jgi:hypothetical protein
MRILHCFADTGVECEALSAYGDVTRVGINPEPNAYTDELIEADATEWEPEQEFDLGLYHPPCQRWSKAAGEPIPRRDKPNLVPDARRIAEQSCEYYIIENVSLCSELRNPVTLRGNMFGLPIRYDRSFETNYHVEQPPMNGMISDYKIGGNDTTQERGPDRNFDPDYWKSVKGYSGDYPAGALRKTSIPRAYINYLIRPLLE